jgi:hydroxyethylthiazole kinase
MKVTAGAIWSDIVTIRKSAPLVHNITNYVVMNSTANALLAIGAAPIMAHAEEEMDDIVDIAGALVINIGTLSDQWVRSMVKAAARATKRGIPVVLDPVGAGATRYRTETAQEMVRSMKPAVIRGNASEIMAAGKVEVRTKGVESQAASGDARETARRLSAETGGVVCVSGAVDYVVSAQGVLKIRNGHPMMTRVTGMGCAASALCGAFAAVNREHHLAAAHAMTVMGIAGEIAAARSAGSGSMQVNFLDALFCLTEEDIARLMKVEG